MLPSLEAEWLETDGLGGYASGTAGLLRTRRYHALLLAATTPPTGRVALVAGCELIALTPLGRFPLSAERYAPDAIAPDGRSNLRGFEAEPWPRWRFALPDGTSIEQSLVLAHGLPRVALSWRLLQPRAGVRLAARPLLSGRDAHALHHENPAFRFAAEVTGERVVWRPYDTIPAIEAHANGHYNHAPLWYRNVLYTEERARGFDHLEDLASPGTFTFDLSRTPAWLVLEARKSPGEATAGPRGAAPPSLRSTGDAAAIGRALQARERRRRDRFPSRLHRAADAYVVRRGGGKSVIAGYPWFADWGRDTFIALRGLCLAAGRLDEAESILLQWSTGLSDGMLPNCFPDGAGEPLYNAVDASLWYVIAAHEFRMAALAGSRRVPHATETAIARTIEAILDRYAQGARFGIGVEEDGLLAAEAPGAALTWMDAIVGGRPVTPRAGKAVEVQALWINALRIGSAAAERFGLLHDRALASFRERFPIPDQGGLYDVIDVDREPGRNDATLRPNQIFAVGGLPFPLIEGPAARALVDQVEARLLTPLGLRTLDRDDPAYRARYAGTPEDRDRAYHQGTVWPWLLGPFVEAWVRARGGTPAVKRQARVLFLEPLLEHLEQAGLEHLSEVADGDSPHTPGGCPFQAWSVGEVLRLSRTVLMENPPRKTPGRTVHRPAHDKGTSR